MARLVIRPYVGGVAATIGLATLAIVVCSACSSATDVGLVDDHLSLVTYDGAPLPVVVQKLPSIGPDGSPVDCVISLVSGSLQLTAEGKFALALRNSDSCSGQTHAATADSGTYSRSGDSLSFAIGPAQLYWGRLNAGQFTLHYSGAVLEFDE